MILSGEKTEEYREIKSYWTKRIAPELFTPCDRYDRIIFRNGYAHDAPEMTIELVSIFLGTGNPRWGAIPLREYYVLQLGKILETNNI